MIVHAGKEGIGRTVEQLNHGNVPEGPLRDQFAHCCVVVVEGEVRFLHFEVRKEAPGAVPAIKRPADDMVEAQAAFSQSMSMKNGRNFT
jgi:hypothetical protein